MKFSIKPILAVLMMALFLVSCRNENSDIDETSNPSTSLKKIKDIDNNDHIIELYSVSGTTALGYNELSIRIKNKSNNQYEKNATITWTPMMHMTSMSHSCPKSLVTKNGSDDTLYNGYIVFQMPQNASEFWDLKIDYTINGTDYTATSVIDVPVSDKKTVASFLGSDNKRYIVAYINPKNPKVALNDMTAGVWMMQDMMTFPVANGYTLKIDPRMPGMGNHSSPNNVNLTQISAGSLYKGKLSLTMTGYWKINLQLADASGNIVGGNEVTDTQTSSSLFFEIDF